MDYIDLVDKMPGTVHHKFTIFDLVDWFSDPLFYKKIPKSLQKAICHKNIFFLLWLKN